MWSAFFIKKLWCCCHTGDHPQGDLAMFDYRPAMKVKIIKIFLYHGYLLEQCIETLGFS
jgi:hypothetical protein